MLKMNWLHVAINRRESSRGEFPPNPAIPTPTPTLDISISINIGITDDDDEVNGVPTPMQ